MKIRLRQLTSFNGYDLTATNSTYTTRMDFEGLEAISRSVVTPFGTEIDLDGNFAAPVKRLPIRAYLMVDAANPGVADRIFSDLSAMCGLVGPLKGKAHNAASPIMTCSARFVNISGTLEPIWFTSSRTWQKFTLVFKQKSDWV